MYKTKVKQHLKTSTLLCTLRKLIITDFDMLRICCLICFIFISLHLKSAVTVTVATGGTGISADLAANACGTPAYTTLGNIVISEAVKTDFPGNATDATIVLDAPTNWQFNPGVGTPSFSGPDLTAASVSVTATKITITWSTDGGANNLTDQITISGIQVQAIDGSIQPASGNITCSSMTGTNVVGITVGVTNFGSLSLSVGANMSYVSSTVTQNNTDPVYKGDTKVQVIGIEIVACKWATPMSVTSVVFSDQSSNVSDLSNARLYYTGTSSTFATTTQVGSTTTPSASISFSPATVLTSGTNYFWLAYDVSTSATCDPNYIDAQLTTLEVNTSPVSPSPTVTNPSGNRKIHCKTPYYSQGDLAIDNLASWNSARDGSGSAPVSFDNGYVLVIQSGDDMTTGTAATLTNFVVENGGSVSISSDVTLTSLDIKAGATVNASRDNSPGYGLPEFPVPSINGLLPFAGSTNTDQNTQVLWKGTEMTSVGMSSGAITSMGLNIFTKRSTTPYNNFKIQICHSSKSNLNTPEAGPFTTVYNDNYSTTSGANIFIFTTPFVWDGTQNIVVQICWDNSSTDNTDDMILHNGTSNETIYIVAASGIGCNLSPSTTTVLKPSTTFNFIPASNSVINIKETFINNGTFNASSGKVIFSGTSVQKIQGTSTTTFNNIEIANATGVTLETPINIGGIMTFTSGDFISDVTNIITFNDGSSHSSAADGSHINGHCKSIYSAANSFTFPLGDGTNYTPLDINFNSGTFDATDYVRASVTSGMHSEYTLASHIKRYWSFTDDGTITSPDYNWRGTYKDGDIVGTEGDIVAKKWNGSWVSFVTTETYGANVLGGNSATSFSDGGGEGGGPMPIELIDFEATKTNENTVLLYWQTATEINNDYFTVEKSPDGLYFQELAQIKGSGNSHTKKNYKLIDNFPFEKQSYYRLKQTDFNGDFEYFNVVSVNFDTYAFADDKITVFPNPVSTGFPVNITFSGLEKNKKVLTILNDMYGRLLYSKIIFTDNTGFGFTGFDIESKISPGIYFIEGTSDNRVYRKRLLVH